MEISSSIRRAVRINVLFTANMATKIAATPEVEKYVGRHGAHHSRPLSLGAYPRQLRIRAFLQDCKEANEVVLVHKRMRITRLAVLDSVDFFESVVIERMDRQIRVGATLINDIQETRKRSAPRFECGLPVGVIPNSIARQTGIDAAPYDAQMRLVSILERNHRCDRARSVAGRDVKRKRGITERQLHPIGGDHVLFWPQFDGLIALVHRSPVGFGHDDVRMVGILNVLRTEIPVAVVMTQDDVLNLCRIEGPFSSIHR